MSDVVFGETSNLKPSQARTLARLGERRVSADAVVSAPLARDLLALSHELNRRIGLFLDRRGRVNRVILGDAHSLELPEFERVRGADGRLRGIRLVLTHLVPDPLDREELADLAKLRLDMVAALHDSPGGMHVDIACLEPAREKGKGFAIRRIDRAPVALLSPDAGGRNREAHPRPDLPSDFTAFIRELEGLLVAATAQTKAAGTGTRAMVLQVHTDQMNREGGIEARQAELRELCRTAGVDLVELVCQRRRYPDPRTFLGSGKLREVLISALEQDVELLICDPELSASQARVIADSTDLGVIDRTMLILDIFAQHARSSDGKLQVELAQLRYRLPRMIGKGTMMSRLGGGIGGRGPGESKLEVDRRRAQKRINELEKRLQKLQRQRDQRRARRRRSDVPVVAIVGYTNAGKSTLLNTVTESEVIAENKLFATLDPTVRRVRFPDEREVVMLDTVGFIRELPPALMQAFSATLEEVAEADLLLHVVDATDPDNTQQIRTVEKILGDLGAGGVERFMVYNKCDLLPPELILPPEEQKQGSFQISAQDRRSTRGLMLAIEERLWQRGKVDSPRPDYAVDGSEPVED
ncbi:GTP-binding protein, HSR1-related [Plesiocystis pacifica SIR-1]|uniref:GTPase HflX n=1 Tax=Plesiocystis pacifica SIR-1 TaxID=391625 RepID=A6G4F3_9BACT|nr:GTPase HflX [Plesiocystis pacifica]EDM79265.1 GTP-binding protein, HSR1-related [Plesiocystis pacifica SIR-1]